MRETIRKILSEEGMDWTSDVKASLPDDRVLKKVIKVELPFQDFLTSMYNYDFIDVILVDGRVIEITVDSYDVKYNRYNSLTDLVETDGLSWVDANGVYLTRGDFNTFDEMVMSYVNEFSMDVVPKSIEGVIKKVIPLEIYGVYRGSL